MNDFKCMKGLMYKDLQLLLQSKKLAISFIFIFIFGASFPENIMFVVSYTTMIFCFMGFNSLSYEEYDNCIPYLITMPITRKLYVKEKYLFSIGFTFLGWLFSFIICYFIQSEDSFILFFIQCFVVFLSMVVFQIIMIPIQIKYGGEKSRIVLFAMVGIILGIVAFASKIIDNLNPTKEVMNNLKNIWNFIQLYGGFIGIFIIIAIIFISYQLSIKFFEEKEY